MSRLEQGAEQQIDEFANISSGILPANTYVEKQRRHLAYSKVNEVVSGLLLGSNEALFEYPREIAFELGKRTVFLCRDDMPGHGWLVRVIINDEAHDPISGSRSLSMRDTIISPATKSLTFQQNKINRDKADGGWTLNSNDGPLLERRHDHLRIVSGKDYIIRIPKTLGYPRKPVELLENRILLETLSEDLEVLDGAKQEVGYPSLSGIMS